MGEQEKQIKNARSVGTTVQAVGVLVAIFGGFAALVVAVNAESFGLGFLGVAGAIVAGLVVYGLGQVLFVLAAILLEVWSQGKN